jgi:hypothetical protein
MAAFFACTNCVRRPVLVWLPMLATFSIFAFVWAHLFSPRPAIRRLRFGNASKTVIQDA